MAVNRFVLNGISYHGHGAIQEIPGILQAKGFTDVSVNIVDDTADVVINMPQIDDAQRAQIEDIMKRKTGVAAEKIVITPME